MNKYQTFQSGPKKGQPKTLTDRVVRYLVEKRGMREVESRSRFRQFKNNTGDQNYFVGKAGAVRAGRTASDSVSLTDQILRLMKIWERVQEMDKAEAEKNINCLTDQILQLMKIWERVQEMDKAEAEKNINCLDGVIHKENKP